MAEYSWKGKREKKRQSRVGNGFMTFFFFFGFGFIYLFWFYFFSFNTVLTWKIVGASKTSVLYIYIDDNHEITIYYNKYIIAKL